MENKLYSWLNIIARVQPAGAMPRGGKGTFLRIAFLIRPNSIKILREGVIFAFLEMGTRLSFLQFNDGSCNDLIS